ncbi:MAG: AraC family transcriptional regulator, partial [Pseudomonadota bacterium]
GDTVGAYILRRRIAMAARDLICSEKTVSSIAYEYGFESHDVFTRAFTRVYGMPPNKYRQGSGAFPLKRLAAIANDNDTGDGQMKFNVVNVEGFYVIGMECRAAQWDSDGAIGRLWSDFLPRIEEIKQVLIPITMYGICEHENCSGGSFNYMAGIGVDPEAEPPQGMSRRLVRKQSFFQACVPEDISIPDAYSGTTGYAKSLGYELEDYDNIEVYEETFQDPDISSFKLLIPIK